MNRVLRVAYGGRGMVKADLVHRAREAVNLDSRAAQDVVKRFSNVSAPRWAARRSDARVTLRSPKRGPLFSRLAAIGIAAAFVGCDGGVESPAPTVPPPSPAPPPTTDTVVARCAEEGRTLEYGFFAHFEPISHAASPEPGTEAFSEHLGYEADLLSALEAMDGAGLAFRRRGIDVWPGIWLLPSTPGYDLVGGGIVIREERTLDVSGRLAISFTSGHIEFGHSVLVRAADADRLAEYGDLKGDVRVGVSSETTNEARFLQIVGLIDDDGVLLAGTRVTTPGGIVVADGSAAYRIAASGSSPNLADRSHLAPASPELPQVVFFGHESVLTEQPEALASGQVDALAGDSILNATVEQRWGGALVVTAIDTLVDLGGFALDQGEEALLACLDDKLNYLTDERNIGYAEWLANPTVFLERAEAWTP